MKISTPSCTALFLLAFCAASSAQTAPAPHSAIIDEVVVENIRDFLRAPIVWKSVVARNAVSGSLSGADIDRLDKLWRAERKTDDQPTIAGVLTSPLSAYLTRIQAGGLGLYSEIFVVDQKGLNVGQSATTSDYWQGDEAKFQKTFPVGPDAVFVDEPEFNEDTGTWRAQVNLTVVNSSGKAIGAATIEVNMTELERRRALGLGS